MGKLRNYTVSRQTAPARAPEKRATPASRKGKRTLGLALVAAVGIAAGGGLGAALYHFDSGPNEDLLAEENAVSAEFAAAAEAVFNTSPIKKEPGELQLKNVTTETPRVATGTVKTNSDNGLTWTADDDKNADLPNVVVLSSKAPVEETVEPPAMKVASLLPVSVLSRKTTDNPQALLPAGTEPLAYSSTQQTFARDTAPAAEVPVPTATEQARAVEDPVPAAAETVPARLLKQQIEARLGNSAGSTAGDPASRTLEVSANATAAEEPLAIAGARHFIALPETVESVEEALALQNGWKTTSNAYVNLRARPNNKGEVITVIPAKEEFLVVRDCRRWCAVLYDGRKGYVHRSFVSQTKKPKVTVDVAETEAEVIALETRMAAQGSNQFFTPAQSTATFAAQLAADEGYRGAYATKYVNMRVAPKKDATILTVIPNDAEFMVEPVCKHWCGVVYKGQKGFVYRTYFQFTGKEG